MEGSEENTLKDGDRIDFTFPDDEAGKAFVFAIKKIVERKLGRNDLYKDNWYDRNRITYHTDRIDSKAGRIKQAEDNFFLGKISLQELMDILEEEAGDIAVYALFVMAKLDKLKTTALKEGGLPMDVQGSVSFYLSEKIEWRENDGAER